MQNLYAIDQALRNIGNALEANGGVITPEMEADLDNLNMNKAYLQAQMIALYHEVLSNAERTKAERERLAKIEKAQEATAETIRRQLLASMLEGGEEKITTAIGTASIRTNPPSVLLTSEIEAEPMKLPHKFLRVVTQYSADKKAIIAAAEAGETLPDGVQVVRAKRLDIK